MITKVHIYYVCQSNKWNPIFNHWLICLQILCCIKWKGLEMVDKMCDIFCPKHGTICRNTMIKWIVWNDQPFLFLSGNKCLVTINCFSWKNIFQNIEMDFWMYIWQHTSIMESLIFLFFFVFVGWQISKELCIGHISQFAMSRLRKRHHLNVNVWKWRSMFVKCTICESLKDLISKLGKNSNAALEYDAKLRKHILHQ
jgi:hypothetical protein